MRIILCIFILISFVNVEQLFANGGNPAENIIKKAIEKKNRRYKKLLSYEYEAYTKDILRTEEDFSLKRKVTDFIFGEDDSTALKISAITEYQSKGYFKKPAKYKKIIIARNKRENFPSSLNIFIDKNRFENFYQNRLRFIKEELPGPLAEDAIGYYDYSLKDISLIDNKPAYKIYMTPANPENPGFEGYLYISTGSYDLLKVNVILNNGSNHPGIFDSINVIQQFSMFKDSIYMPTDYHLFTKINYFGIEKFVFELNSSLYNYKINPQSNDSLFDKALTTVLPDVDEKDSTYWNHVRKTPITEEEKLAFRELAGSNYFSNKFEKRYSIISKKIYLSDNLYINAPPAIYHFNRVEGHALDLGLHFNNALNRRLTSKLKLSYGFSDKRLKSNLKVNYLLGKYRTFKISAEAFNQLKVLFSGEHDYNIFATTALALVAKEDFQDYYFSKGFNFGLQGEVLPFLTLSAGFINRTDNNAIKNTSVSLFKTSKTYRSNPPIYETKINAFKAGFNLDFRDFIEDGFFRRRTLLGESYVIFNGNITYSNPDILNSGERFTKYELSAFGRMNLFRSTFLNYKIYGMYNQGRLPLQMLYTLPGDINLLAQNYSFRTLEFNEVTGDRVVTLNLYYFLGNELFNLLNIPLLKDSPFQLSTHFNAAFSDISSGSAGILPRAVSTLRNPFYEIGFGLSHAILPVRVEFTWRLNHRNGDNNFRVGFYFHVLQMIETSDED